MPKKRRYRGKEAREIADEVQAAGGSVEILANGHLRVTGPGGSAVIGSKLNTPGAHDTVRNKLARYAGISIRRRGSGGTLKAG